jgi:hypothetical protein
MPAPALPLPVVTPVDEPTVAPEAVVNPLAPWPLPADVLPAVVIPRLGAPTRVPSALVMPLDVVTFDAPTGVVTFAADVFVVAAVIVVGGALMLRFTAPIVVP